MLNKFFFYPLALFFFTLIPSLGFSDIVKPALVEISVKTDGTFQIEIRASIEALLTGINSRYKNTRDAPNAQAYDDFRVLPPEQLRQAFRSFEKDFLQEVKISFDNETTTFHIESVDIPEPGYVKVPRTSIIIVQGEVSVNAQSLSWYYPSRFGDNAVRVRQVDEVNEKWHVNKRKK